MLNSFLVAEALTGLIYHRPPGENSSFLFTSCLMVGEVSLETSPKNIMIQDIINSENSNIYKVEKRIATDNGKLKSHYHKSEPLLKMLSGNVEQSNLT